MNEFCQDIYVNQWAVAQTRINGGCGVFIKIISFEDEVGMIYFFPYIRKEEIDDAISFLRRKKGFGSMLHYSYTTILNEGRSKQLVNKLQQSLLNKYLNNRPCEYKLP